MLQVFIQPEAAEGVEAAIDYYTQVATPALAERFVSEFETACGNLAEFPGIGSLRFAHLLEGAELRTWSLPRFPFRLFYVIEGDTLNILGVEHESRNLVPVRFRSAHKLD